MIRKRYLNCLLICTSIFIIVLHLINIYRVDTALMNFSIEHLWNSQPIRDHRPVQITLSSTADRNHLLIEIDAPFFNDSAPSLAPGPCPELWNYEVVECFFLSSSTNHYLELEFSPHGHYLVLLLVDRRKELKQMLPITHYHIDHPSADRWIGRVLVPRSLFPAHVDRFNAYAIHGQGDARTYESLYPAPVDSEKPDFHRLELFRALNFDSLLDVGEHDGSFWTANN